MKMMKNDKDEVEEKKNMCVCMCNRVSVFVYKRVQKEMLKKLC